MELAIRRIILNGKRPIIYYGAVEFLKKLIPGLKPLETLRQLNVISVDQDEISQNKLIRVTETLSFKFCNHVI